MSEFSPFLLNVVLYLFIITYIYFFNLIFFFFFLTFLTILEGDTVKYLTVHQQQMCMDPTIKSEMGMLYLYFLPSRANPIRHRSTTMGVQLSCIRQDKRQFTTGIIAHCKSHSTCYHTGTNKMKGGKKRKKARKTKRRNSNPESK